MGFSMNHSSSGSASRTRSGPATLAEINVTPLVDVMLVLLIVFMISAPLMQQGVQVDLPKANAGTMNETPEQLVLVVDKQRRIYLGEHLIEAQTLVPKLQAISASKPRIEVVIQADQSVTYGTIAQVMAEVKQAGISRVGLVTEPTSAKSKL